tara:strand:+ start:530 stop:1042 length:513 start_codon:yes stop_codon:yes gene_type:complete
MFVDGCISTTVGKKEFSEETTEEEVKNFLLRGNVSAAEKKKPEQGEEEKEENEAPLRYHLHNNSVCIDHKLIPECSRYGFVTNVTNIFNISRFLMFSGLNKRSTFSLRILHTEFWTWRETIQQRRHDTVCKTVQEGYEKKQVRFLQHSPFPTLDMDLTDNGLYSLLAVLA